VDYLTYTPEGLTNPQKFVYSMHILRPLKIREEMKKKTRITCTTDDNWRLFKEAVLVSPRTFIWGPPGVGKSYTAQQILKTINKNVWQCTLDEDRVVQELLGHFLPKGTVFVWHNGPVAIAFKEGNGLVINELARASSAVKDMFLGILDDPEVASLRLPNDEFITRGKSFKVIATANNPPEDLDEALRDRFDVVIKVDTPHPMIVNDLNKKLPGLGDMILASYKDPARAISPRRAYSFTNLLNNVSREDAAKLAFGARNKEVLFALEIRWAER